MLNLKVVRVVLSLQGLTSFEGLISAESFTDDVLSSVGVGGPDGFKVTIINDGITIVLYLKEMALSTLVMSFRRPGSVVLRVIDDQVTIFLHSQVVRAMSLSVTATRPDGVRRDKVTGAVENQVTVILKSQEIGVVGSLEGLTTVKDLVSQELSTNNLVKRLVLIVMVLVGVLGLLTREALVLLRESLIGETLLGEALLGEALLRETLIRETVSVHYILGKFFLEINELNIII
jgi:hypothetical protein